MSLRGQVYRALNPNERLTFASRLIICLIIAATIVAVIQTEPVIAAGREQMFRWLEIGFIAVFAVEYVLRIWSAPEGGCSRLRYATSLWSLIDLIAVVAALLPILGANLLFLRLLRAVRMVRLAKLGRHSRALTTLGRAVRSRGSHLIVSFSLALVFLVTSATIMYWIEGERQPDQFGSIPRALWWGVATMTTVGYGDVVPQSGLGRAVAGIVALAGIVLIAIPTGIMAAAFSNEIAREREEERLEE